MGDFGLEGFCCGGLLGFFWVCFFFQESDFWQWYQFTSLGSRMLWTSSRGSSKVPCLGSLATCPLNGFNNARPAYWSYAGSFALQFHRSLLYLQTKMNPSQTVVGPFGFLLFSRVPEFSSTNTGLQYPTCDNSYYIYALAGKLLLDSHQYLFHISNKTNLHSSKYSNVNNNKVGGFQNFLNLFENIESITKDAKLFLPYQNTPNPPNNLLNSWYSTRDLR